MLYPLVFVTLFYWNCVETLNAQIHRLITDGIVPAVSDSELVSRAEASSKATGDADCSSDETASVEGSLNPEHDTATPALAAKNDDLSTSQVGKGTSGEELHEVKETSVNSDDVTHGASTGDIDTFLWDFGLLENAEATLLAFSWDLFA